MPEQMTIDEVNRYIHEEIMGKCWHLWELIKPYNPNIPMDWKGKRCIKCSARTIFNPSDNIEDYCSDDSPRRLLEEVIAKIEPLVVIRHPASCGRSELESAQRLVNTMFNSLNLTAEQIARAIVELHKQETADA